MSMMFSGHDSQEEVAEYIISTLIKEDVVHKLIGNNLWLVLTSAKGIKFIVLARMRKCKRDGYGYKFISEDMHPVYYNCPKSFLKLVDEPVNQRSREWREKVMAR